MYNCTKSKKKRIKKKRQKQKNDTIQKRKIKAQIKYYFTCSLMFKSAKLENFKTLILQKLQH